MTWASDSTRPEPFRRRSEHEVATCWDHRPLPRHETGVVSVEPAGCVSRTGERRLGPEGERTNLRSETVGLPVAPPVLIPGGCPCDGCLQLRSCPAIVPTHGRGGPIPEREFSRSRTRISRVLANIESLAVRSQMKAPKVHVARLRVSRVSLSVPLSATAEIGAPPLE